MDFIMQYMFSNLIIDMKWQNLFNRAESVTYKHK